MCTFIISRVRAMGSSSFLLLLIISIAILTESSAQEGYHTFSCGVLNEKFDSTQLKRQIQRLL